VGLLPKARQPQRRRGVRGETRTSARWSPLTGPTRKT
jgi:hypothetical protein